MEKQAQLLSLLLFTFNLVLSAISAHYLKTLTRRRRHLITNTNAVMNTAACLPLLRRYWMLDKYNSV